MSLTTPTTQDIDDQIIASLEASLSQTVPLLPKAVLRVLAKTFAAVFILLYKYGGFIFQQLFVKFATIEDVDVLGVILSPLKEWGRLVGAGDPTAATQAQLDLEITVINQIGQLDPGTQYISTDNGVTYLQIGTVLLDAPTKTATVVAAFDQGGGDGSGTIGNLQIDDEVLFANPLANVQQVTTVTAVVEGADAEDTEVYRQRIFDRFQKRPQGGALIDYVLWAAERAGVVNVYPYTGGAPNGTRAGEVDVFIEVDTTIDPDGIPDNATLTDILDNFIEIDPSTTLATRRPVNAFVNMFAIARTSFDTTVSGIAGVVDLAAVQTDITTALVTFYLDREPFVSGVTQPPRVDAITQSALIGLVEDIVTAANGTFSSVTFSLTAGGAQTRYDLGQGEKAKSGTVDFN